MNYGVGADATAVDFGARAEQTQLGFLFSERHVRLLLLVIPRH